MKRNCSHGKLGKNFQAESVAHAEEFWHKSTWCAKKERSRKIGYMEEVMEGEAGSRLKWA